LSLRLTTVTREMGISHHELFRLLSCALAEQAYELLDGEIVVEEGDRRVSIEYAPERERRIVAFRIPVTDLTFRFTNYGAIEVERFMSRFDRTFHRGGG